MPRYAKVHPLFWKIEEAIKEAQTEKNNWDMAGETAESLESEPLFTSLERIIENGLQNLREMRDHTHKWNDDDYCSVCGLDGRA